MDNIYNVATYNFNVDHNIIIAVDTNVLIAMFYGRDIEGNKIHQLEYTEALEEIVKYNKFVKLHTTTVNISEAFTVIERIEYELYKESIAKDINFKYFRTQEDCRRKLKKAFDAFWEQVSRFIKINDLTITRAFVKKFKTKIQDYRYDCFDAALVDYCLQAGIVNIMTDDIDFVGYDLGINIITANKNALRIGCYSP